MQFFQFLNFHSNAKIHLSRRPTVSQLLGWCRVIKRGSNAVNTVIDTMSLILNIQPIQTIAPWQERNFESTSQISSCDQSFGVSLHLSRHADENSHVQVR